MNAISKRLLSGLMALVMVLSMVPALNLTNFAVETKANVVYGSDNLTPEIQALKTAGNSLDDSDEAFFGTEGYLAKKTCPMCKATNVTWTLDNDGRWEDNGGHYYLDSDTALDVGSGWLIYAGGRHDRTVCVFASEETQITGNGFYINEVHGFQLNIMGNGTFITTAADAQGMHIALGTVDAPNVVNLYGGTFKLNAAKSDRSCLFMNNYATVNIYDGVTIGADSNEGVTVGYSNVRLYNANSTLNMYGGTIQNGYCSDTAGAPVRGGNVDLKYGTFNMYGGTISGGKTIHEGGNVCVDAGDFNMYGGTVIGGESTITEGGGGNIAQRGNWDKEVGLKIMGGTVTGGKAKFGGNIYIRAQRDAAASEIGGTALITNGSATYGGNIAVDRNKTLTMSGGAITGGENANDANSFYGGAVFLRAYEGNGDGSDFIMTGGLISGCTAHWDGGNIAAKGGSVIAIGANATVENGISGKDSSSTVGDGGNFHIPAGASLTVSGTVTGGEARNGKKGDDIYGVGTVVVDSGAVVGEVEMVSGGSLTLKNAPTISNLALNDVQANIDGLSAGADITVTAEEGDVIAENANDTLAGYFTVADDTLEVTVNGSNQLVVTEKAVEIEPPVVPDHSDPNFCSDEKFFGEGGYLEKQYCPACKEFVTWTRITGRADNAHGKTDHYYYADQNGVAPTSARYTPAQIAMIDSNSTQRVCVFIPKNVTVAPTFYPFYTGGTGSIVYNVMGKGTVSAAQEVEIGGNGNTLNLYGITLTWATPLVNKRLLKAGGTSTVNIYGGTVIGQPEPQETTTYSLVTTTTTTATINMYGGTIQNGHASVGAYRGGNVTVLGTFNMYDGTITGGNTTMNGGNVAVLGGTFKMYDGTITGGTAGDATNDIYVRANNSDQGTGSMVMEGGTVGKMTMSSTGSTLTLKKAPVINNLVLSGVRANIDELSAGADITVTAGADTILTAASTNAEAVKDCFKVADGLEVIVNDEKQLVVKAIVVAPPIADLFIEGVPTEYSDTEALIAAYEAAKEEHKSAYIYTYKAYQAGYGAGNAAESPFLELELHEGYEYYIDLHNAFVQLSGAGTLYALDYSNGDDFYGNGKFRIADGADITVAPAAVHPKDGFLYISVEPCDLEEKNCVEGDWMAFRVTAELTGISMRPSEAGWYYKSEYNFADRLYKIGAVAQYGVALNGNTDITEDYFVGQANLNKYTKCTEAVDADDTTNGIQVSGTSGGLFGILKKTETGRSAEANAAALDADIYAKAYVLVDRYPSLAPDQDPGDRYYYVMSDGSVVDTLHEVLDKVNDKVDAGEITEEGKQQKLIAMYNEWNDATEMSLAGQQAWQTINADIAALAALIGG